MSDSEPLPGGDAGERSSDAGPVGVAEDPAPFGRKSDGSPYRTNPLRWRGKAKSRGPGRPAAKAAKNAPPKRKAPAKGKAPRPPRKAASAAELRKAAGKLVAIPAAALTWLGTRLPNEQTGALLQLDAFVITEHADDLAAAIVKTSESVPMLAVLLNRLASVGAGGELVEALLPVVATIAAIHRRIPAEAAEFVGGMHPQTAYERWHAEAQAQADKAAAAAEAAQAAEAA